MTNEGDVGKRTATDIRHLASAAQNRPIRKNRYDTAKVRTRDKAACPNTYVLDVTTRRMSSPMPTAIIVSQGRLETLLFLMSDCEA